MAAATRGVEVENQVKVEERQKIVREQKPLDVTKFCYIPISKIMNV